MIEYSKEETRKQILSKLDNVLKDSAMMILNDYTITEQQKHNQMNEIAELTQYIRDYEKNKSLLEEYRQWKERFEDDGR